MDLGSRDFLVPAVVLLIAAAAPGPALLAQGPQGGRETPEGLLKLARKQGYTPESRQESLRILRKLQEKFPERSQDREVLKLIEERGGWLFEGIPSGTIPHGSNRAEVPFTRATSGSTDHPFTFIIHRVSPASYRRVLESAEPGSLPFPGTDTWAPGSGMTGEVSSNQPLTELKLSFPGEPGLHVIEQSVEGLRKLDTLSVSTFGVLLRAVSGRALAFAFDQETGEPVSGVSIRVRTRERTVEAMTDRQGLRFFDCPSNATVMAWKGEELKAFVLESPLPEKDRFAFITLDRPVCLPGQAIHWKAVLRERKGAQFTIPGEKSLGWRSVTRRASSSRKRNALSARPGPPPARSPSRTNGPPVPITSLPASGGGRGTRGRG